MENNSLTKEITKTLFFSVIALTLVPGIAWYFTSYVLSQYRLSASEFVQFDWVHTTSFWMLIAAAALLCVVLLLCALAFSNRSIQYISFVTGWRLVVFFCIIELLLQGAIATWLSFWVTAVFTKSYFPKVILLVALAVGAGIFYAIVHIFKSLPKESSIEGGSSLVQMHRLYGRELKTSAIK